MIKAIVSSYTNNNLKQMKKENNRQVSFKSNDGMSLQSNDEFIKSVEKERDSIIKWANNRIDKLNAIIEIAKNDVELPKTDKAMIAATVDDDMKLRKAKELLGNPNVSSHDKNQIQSAIDYAEKTRNMDTGHLSGTGAQSVQNATRNAESHISCKGSPDDTEIYTPDDTPDIPDADGDSCDGSDSDSDSGCDESECLSDTADCIS